jgi:imidazolonepropionase-like amidohydrolase
MFRFCLIFLCLFIFNSKSHLQSTILHCGKLIDVDKGSTRDNMSVIISDGVIVGVEQGFRQGKKEDKVIDLKNMTVMPGFWDMHVHIEHESNPKRYEDSFRENESYVALKATKFCEKTLMAGFTTIRDLGGSGINVSLREAIKNGFIIGPRIYTCEKSIATTGGHADPTNGVRDNLKGDPGPKEGVINGPEEAAKAVRQRYKNGADCIKITSTGGVLSVASDGSGPQFTIEEVSAVVRAADDYGYVVAAHAHGTEGIRRAVLGGVHSIEHGTFLTDEVMDLMIEKGTWYVPTISAGKFVAEKARVPNFYPKMVAKKAAEIGPQIQETFGKAYRKGVKIAFGTDTGVSLHGDNAMEFVYMTEAGMKPMEAIQSATKNAALLMRKYDNMGSIDIGKTADIIAVTGDPLKDIKALLKVDFVMKEGVVYKGI